MHPSIQHIYGQARKIDKAVYLAPWAFSNKKERDEVAHSMRYGDEVMEGISWKERKTMLSNVERSAG